MTNINRLIFAPCLLAMTLLASCQNTQKPEGGNVDPGATSQTAPATKVVMTPVEVDGQDKSKADTKDAGKSPSSASDTMPVSSPSSEYAEDRLRDMEKGLRRLQSLPSAEPKPKSSRRTRG